MAPKSVKGKGVAKGAGTVEMPESALSGDRTKSAFFFPSTVDVHELRASFRPLWGAKTGGENSGHPATRVIPAACADPAPNRYPFFVDYLSCGLCPPFSDFFCDIMHTFGFRLLDFTPNAVACMAFFAHLCEGFAGVQPNTALFRHYFFPRIQPGGAVSGCVTWIPRSKGAYPDGAVKERWEEWRGRWCWIEDENPPEFCKVRRVPPVRGSDWSDVDAADGRLTVATTRILRLTLAGLTLEMIGADFIRHRIAPLHNKRRPAWLFTNPADIMRLRPGLDHNFTVLAHAHFCQRLFQLDVGRDGEVERTGKAARAAAKVGKALKGPFFKLPAGVVPLCNNSRRSKIIAMMPDCNAHGPVPSWKEPKDADVQQFFDTLIEVYVNADAERWLVMDTTQAELDYIATRAREAQLAMEAGSAGGVEDKAATAAEEEELTRWAAATEEVSSADT